MQPHDDDVILTAAYYAGWSAWLAEAHRDWWSRSGQ